MKTTTENELAIMTSGVYGPVVSDLPGSIVVWDDKIVE